jgi:Domain of unknown function (DUF4863)
MIADGVRDGWAANVEVDGRKYRRSRIAEPRDIMNYFSITATGSRWDMPTTATASAGIAPPASRSRLFATFYNSEVTRRVDST